MANEEEKKEATKKEYRERLKFEHELINHRITWLLTSQSLLFAAYALAPKPGRDVEMFLKMIPWVGLMISLFIFLGIFTSYIAKYYALKTYRKESKDYNEPIGVRTWITLMGFISEIFLPLIFIIAWLIFILVNLFNCGD